MRSRRLIIVLVLALASGLLAGWLALRIIRESGDVGPIQTAAAAPTEVVVAARDLPLGRVLTVEDVKLTPWPSDVAPANFSSSVEDVLGRGLITPVVLNEPLLSGKMALKEAGGGLPIVIPEGMRALSVRVDEVIQVAGFVLPGTRVDVFVTIDPGQQQNNPITKMILQNVSVLTANQIVQTAENGEPTTATVVTLLVTPQDAEKLILASTRGRIQLGLRNTLDLDSLTTTGIRIPNLLPGSAPARTAPRRTVPTRRSTGIEIYRGPDLSTESVEGGS
ncbi:MAG: Flp pilus assembly protein CpaB [Gemmatimonadota bacterium]|nr:Flp pilus assembly protein CpaB [Gemmatimonadota bacterium]MDH3427065.1 Flp pilus assembly protein CpaB [Gemmatimonadota bacterium]